MDDIEAPSFSLGLDLDAEPEPPLPPIRENSLAHTSPLSSCNPRSGDDDAGLAPRISGADTELQPDSQDRLLKRLRRGIKTEESSASGRVFEVLDCSSKSDDEIEEFSSPEDLVRASARHQSVSSSSKFSLHGHGILTSQKLKQQKVTRKVVPSGAPASEGSGTGFIKSFFEKYTRNPIRRFQLLDSDSDEDLPSTSKDVNRQTSSHYLLSRDRQSLSGASERKTSAVTPQGDDLWKGFSPKNFNIPTPAFDEICEEYFRSTKNNNRTQNPTYTDLSCSKIHHQSASNSECFDSAVPCPPAHRYFDHSDQRIQSLIRKRLPNFWPLGIANNKAELQKSNVIDYTSQFGKGGVRAGGETPKVSTKPSSTKRSKSNKSKVDVGTQASGGWMDPKNSATIPKDAGKRRVHANGQSAGRWYTSPEGRKVYVSRSGEELTGVMAFRCYQKESGAGFKKPGKKKQKKKPKG